jgi:hypothetical protein
VPTAMNFAQISWEYYIKNNFKTDTAGHLTVNISMLTLASLTENGLL